MKLPDTLEEFEEWQRKAISREEVIDTRNIKDFRGCGLAYGDLQKAIANDPIFNTSYKLTYGRTMIPPLRLYNLYLLIRYYLPRLDEGDVIEFGSWRGGSLLFMASVSRLLGRRTRFYGLDTFEGFPDGGSEDDILKPGGFILGVDFEEVCSFADRTGLSNIHFVKGPFEDTARDLLNGVGSVCLAHIDCDLGNSVAFSYNVVRDYMVFGGYYVFDDPLEASCLGAFHAIERYLVRRDGLHAEQVFPQLVYRA